MARKAADVKAGLRSKKQEAKLRIHPDNGISSGSTLLNLAATGSPDVAYPKGVYSLFVGDSSSGKTVIALTAFAEAAANLHFKDYQFLFYNKEGGALMDRSKYYGDAVVKRLTEREPDTLEDLYYQLSDDMDKGPIIGVVDSQDAFLSEDDQEQFSREKRATAKGKEVSGSYGTSKAKKNSANLRVINNKLRDTGSILIILSQTRDNIGFEARFNPKTRSGGRAMRFYARLEMWSSIREKLKADVNGIPRQIGIVSEIKIVKNHLSGWEGKIAIPIYRSIGVDDVGGCIDYLLSEGRWTEAKKVISASDLGVEMKREALVKYIETNDLESDLRFIVSEVWQDVESRCKIERKQRYS